MFKDWTKVALGYVLIGVLGAIPILMVMPVFRLSQLQTHLAHGEQMLSMNLNRDALTILRRFESRAELYPAVSRHLLCASITCYVRLGDPVTAESIAKTMLEQQASGGRPPRGLIETLQVPTDILINRFLESSTVDGPPGAWTGYETLARELIRTADVNRLDTLYRTLAAKNANPALLKRIQTFIINRRPAADIAATPGSQSTTPPPPSRTKEDHMERAKKHLEAREYSSAILECERALAENPKDAKVLALLATAKLRGARWGYVRSSKAKVYDRTGKLLGGIDPATLVEVTTTQTSPSGELAFCILPKPIASATNVCILTRDLDLRSGLLKNASAENRDLRRRRAEILAEIDRMKSEAAAAQAKDNPHYRDYEKATEAYKQYWAKVKELKAKRDAATSETHVTFSDELQKMKGEDVRLFQAISAAKKEFTQWNEAHPVATGNEPAMRKCEADLQAIQTKIDAIETTP